MTTIRRMKIWSEIIIAAAMVVHARVCVPQTHQVSYKQILVEKQHVLLLSLLLSIMSNGWSNTPPMCCYHLG